MKNLIFTAFLFLLFISCSPDTSFMRGLVNVTVVIEAYSEEDVSMILVVKGKEPEYFFIHAGDSISKTITANHGDVISWFDRSHEDGYVLWYKISQVDYGYDSSEVYCENSCAGMSSYINVIVD